MTNEVYEKLSDYYKSVVNTWQNELYLIDRGVRSVCTDFLHYDKNDGDAIVLIYELEQMTIRRNLYFAMFDKIDKEDGKVNLTIYAYKYMHQLPLLKYVENGAKGYIREWILGKLLGYSDESMDEYLCSQLVDCFDIHDNCKKKDEPVKEEKKTDETEPKVDKTTVIERFPSKEKFVPSKLSSKTNEGSKEIFDEWDTLFSNFVKNLDELEKQVIPPQPNLYTGPNFTLVDYIGTQYVFSKVEGFDDVYSIKIVFDNQSGGGLLEKPKLVGYTRIRNEEFRNLKNKYCLGVFKEEKYKNNVKITKKLVKDDEDFVKRLKKILPSLITNVGEIEKSIINAFDLYHKGSFTLALDNGDCYAFSKIAEFGDFYIITKTYDCNIGKIEPFFVGCAHVTNQDYESLANEFHVSQKATR